LTTRLTLYICTLSSMSVFLSKTHLHSMSFIPSGESTKVHTWLVYMKFILDFMILSHFFILHYHAGQFSVLVIRGGGMLRARVGFSPGQDFINIFWLVLCKNKFVILDWVIKKFWKFAWNYLIRCFSLS